jgi:hypothetical protein
MRVTPAHILNELDLSKGMMIWMRMGTSGAVSEGIPGTVIAVLPTIDKLPICLIFSGSIGNTKTFSVFNQ